MDVASILNQAWTIEGIQPPGTFYDILGHPTGRNQAVEVAVVYEHRFAFYYWMRWWFKFKEKSEGKMPILVSIDWHEDLAGPNGSEQTDLVELNTADAREVALFTTYKLCPLNDGHILAAAYLNLISDIYVLCKQRNDESFDFVDRFGNTHKVIILHDVNDFVMSLEGAQAEFDIDVDYFTETDEACGGGEDIVLVDDDDITKLIAPDSDLMKWISERLKGMTIALEPEYCGGLRNSNHIFEVIDRTLFKPGLFHDSAEWRD